MPTIYRRGNRWYVQYRVDGKLRRQSVGKDRKLAELKLKEIEVKLAKRELFHLEEKLLSDYVEEYTSYAQANKSKRAFVRDQGILSNLSGLIQVAYLHEVTPVMLEHYKQERLKSVKPATVNRDLNTIKNLFAKAVEWGYLKENPAKVVRKLPEKEKRHPRFLSQEEIGRLLSASQEPLRSIIRVLLYTGLRRDELIHLEWNDVDLDRGLIRVESKDGWHPKGYKPRSIPINGRLQEVLSSLPRQGKLVFDNGRGSFVMWAESLSRAFRHAAKRGGNPGATLHTLRHTFAPHLVMAGQDLRTVHILLGVNGASIDHYNSDLRPPGPRSPERGCRAARF